MSEIFDFDKVIDRREVPALKYHRMVLGDDGMDLFPASVADMDFEIAPAILEAMQGRLKHGLFGYEAVPDELFQALTGWFQRRYDWRIDQEHILRAPNVLNSLAIAVSLFSEPGEGIIIQPPVFFDFYDVIKENHRRIKFNPLVLKDGRYEMDFEGLEKAASDSKTKLFFLCNPHNPVGRVWRRDELELAGEICRHHNVVVVSDEIHADITYSGHRYTPFASLSDADAENSITCLSPAKSFNIAACCSSFTVVPDETRREAFKAENSRLTVNKNNAFASTAMEAAYKHGDTWLDACIDYLWENISLLRKRLDGIQQVNLIEPEGTFLVWLDMRNMNLSPDELTKFLRTRAKWAVARGIAFGEEGAGFARVNIACSRRDLDAALRQLEAALE